MYGTYVKSTMIEYYPDILELTELMYAMVLTVVTLIIAMAYACEL